MQSAPYISAVNSGVLRRNLIKKVAEFQRLLIFGGSGEIRTHGGLSTLDGFQDRCIKPLCHTSNYDGFKIGGSGEIRTHGGLSTLDGFQDRCIKPLCHAS